MSERSSVSTLEAAFNRISDSVFILDADENYVFVNTAGARMCGRSAAELVGRNIWDEFPDMLGSVFEDALRRAGQTQEAIDFEHQGAAGVFAARIFPSPDGVTIYYRDVTHLHRLEQERRQAQEELRAADALRLRFEALVEASGDFIAIANLEGQVIYLNPAGRALVGLEPTLDVRTTTIADYLTPEGMRASVEVEQPAVLRDGAFSGLTTLRDHRGGPPIPVAVSSFLIRDPQTHEPFALATVQRDIRERVRAERDLRRVADERQRLLERLVSAEEAERARIAAEVHDDSVQACAAVDLRLGLLYRRVRVDAPHLVDEVIAVQQAAGAATDRLRQLLFDLEPPAEGLTLDRACAETARFLFNGEAITWSVVGAHDVTMEAAPLGQAVRVVKQALINVRSHAHASHVVIEIRAVDHGVEVSVSDDGIGIASPEATSPPGHRGLTTMRDRADVSGGWLRLERGDPRGTTVRFFLPVEWDAPVRSDQRVPSG